jgi:hypothetical protein
VFLQDFFPSTFFNPSFYNKGEILIFKKPRRVLKVSIQTEKETYSPGEEVNFEVTLDDIPALVGGNKSNPE